MPLIVFTEIWLNHISISHDELSGDEKIVNESQQYEEWMYIAQMVGPLEGNHLVGNFES